MADLLKFDQLIKHDDLFLNNLLFGNGFSIYFGSRFQYGNLFEEGKQTLDEFDLKLFENLDTRNFETVLRNLLIAIETNNTFGIEYDALQKSYDRIKTSLIDSVRRVHPQANEISTNKIQDLKAIFKLFRKKVFTTNYDLLAYWGLNMIGNSDRKIADEFGYDPDSKRIMYKAGVGVNESDNPVRLYHLHGSLHLYMEDGDIIKITRGTNPVGSSEKSLLETITQSYNWGYLPLYVAEGTWKQKLNTILNNRYFRDCYNALSSISNGLTIFGQSLDNECDRHIIDAIKQSKINKLAYGIYDVTRASKTKHKVESAFEDSSIQIEFYDSRYFFESVHNMELDMMFS